MGPSMTVDEVLIAAAEFPVIAKAFFMTAAGDQVRIGSIAYWSVATSPAVALVYLAADPDETLWSLEVGFDHLRIVRGDAEVLCSPDGYGRHCYPLTGGYVSPDGTTAFVTYDETDDRGFVEVATR